MTDEIDQDVREAAAVTMVLAEMRDEVIAGRFDNHPSVQAFARIKAAGREKGLREAAEVARRTANGCASAVPVAAQPWRPAAWAGSADYIASAIEALLSEKPA